MKSFINFIIATFVIIGTTSGQNIDKKFFNDTHSFLQKNVKNGRVNYAPLKKDAQLKSLIQTIAKADLTNADDATKQAFYINAYNLLVINQAAQKYPLQSVQDIAGFFDKKKNTVGGKNLTLNKLEKDYLLKPYKDARFHFVLVCGALGCPPITDFAYTPQKLEQQLEMQTKLALNDNNFIKVNGNKAELSQIFKWYTSDFGGNTKSVIKFINKYRTNKIPSSAKVSFYNYSWNLNDTANRTSSLGSSSALGNNASRYVVSSTIKKGSFEIKVFNNLYSQRTGNEGNLTDRSTFNTTSLSVLYGLTNRFNIGFNTRYRRVRNDRLPSSPLAVFGNDLEDGESARQGITAFGPQIRYAPVPKWENFSIQSSFVFPIGEDLAGNSTQPYIDWNGATWWTQVFNDFPIGTNFSLFTEVDFLLEDIGRKEENSNRFSTPATVIFSYNPSPKITLYSLGGFSPFWQTEFDYFVQGGLGAKYQFTPNLELELLYTDFSNKFLSQTGGQAATYNVGLRINL
ncbi:MAG: DUF547 domain-containing protein [Saprospiraceae bacterium]